MWNFIILLLLLAETLLLVWITLGRLRGRRLHETPIFVGTVFALSMALYLVPYLHGLINNTISGNSVLELLECITAALKMFLGDAKTDRVAAFSVSYPLFTGAYVIGVLLALYATVSAALEAFGSRIRSALRLRKALKQPVCDVVLGDSEAALLYAKSSQAVVLLPECIGKDRAVALTEEGYTVWRKELSERVCADRRLNTVTDYHIVCPKAYGDLMPVLNAFVAYQNTKTQEKNIHLYLEMEPDTANAVCREILDKNKLSHLVTTFCTDELMARSLMEQHPITAYIPDTFISEDASIVPEAAIHVAVLGYGSLSRAIYRQSVLNNQLVSFRDGQYREHPVRYFVYDKSADKESWILEGMKNTLDAMDSAKLFTKPEMPYEVKVDNRFSEKRAVLEDVCATVRKPNSYTFIIVDAGDAYSNIEIGGRLRTMLAGETNFHLFVRSDRGFTVSDERTTYYGDFSALYTHDVIVNDSLDQMAKRINEVYEGDAAKAAEKWGKLDRFTLRSNLFAAENLRVKLNLLGLDYVSDGKAEGIEKLADAYPTKGEYAYSEYFARSRRNALLAQEHARWNAYHLMEEYLPMGPGEIAVKQINGDAASFHTKRPEAGKHACLTTFNGLDELSAYLAAEARSLTGVEHTAADYDYYKYDEMLIKAAAELMKMTGCSIIGR